MNKFNLTDEEINCLKATAEILSRFTSDDDSTLNEIINSKGFYYDNKYNELWEAMREYLCFHNALNDMGEIIGVLANEMRENTNTELKEESEVEEKITLKSLEGHHILQGVELGKVQREEWGWNYGECNYVKFTLDGKHYMAVENPSDGYRSYCEEVKVVKEPCRTLLPNIKVNVKYLDEKGDNFWNEDCDIIQVFDVKNNKMILEVGTENVGDWYPGCVFHYYPENMYCNEGR